VSGYTNFHEVLGPGNLASDLALSAFLSGIPLYRQVLGKGNEEAFKIVELLQTLTDMRIFQAQQQLVALPFSNGPAFEAYLRTFLTLCFEPHYENLSIREQVPNRGRLRIRDFIIVNNESSSPFLRSLKTKGADFLLFDAKNYAEPLTTREIDTFRQYLHNNPSFGNFGVILSRKGASEHCQESIFRELPTIKIVVLNEDDLLLMLEHAGTGRSAVAILEEKYNELMLQL
ncbi:MAG TPA: hypothetical protein VFV38_30310, partial [Ktedonobacteraceae bacterium]|nr:hypothetical protein [Ktedonobacteraceae bacterium]